MKRNLKTNKPVVLFVSDRTLLGGAELFLLDLLTCIQDKICPIFLFSKTGPLSERLPNEKILFFSPLKLRFLSLSNWIKLGKIVLECRDMVDVVYVNTAYANRVGLVLASLIKAKEVVHIHSFVSPQELKRDKYRFRSSNKVICSSQALLNEMKGLIPEEKLSCIYPGIIVDRFIYNPYLHKPLQVCLVGRISRIKKQHLFVELAKRLPSFNFHIVGAVEDELKYFNYVKEMVKTYRLNNVFFHDFLDDIPRFLSEMDVLISMSEDESFGRVFLEAMASGTLVVASSSPGALEVIQDGKTGIIVKENNLKNWKKTLLWACESTKTVMDMKQNARLDVEMRFDMRKISKNWLDLILSLSQV